MLIEAKTPFLMTVLLVTVRFSAALLLSPLFAIGRIPVKFRLILLLALSFTLVVMGGEVVVPDITNSGALVEAVMYESMIGGLFAFGMFAAFAAFQFGGRLVDLQMGFGVAGLIDPSTNTQSPLIGTALNMMGVLTFLLLDGHHLVIKVLADSLERIPPGSGLVSLSLDALVMQFSVVFVLGFALVAPVIVTLFLMEAAMAVAARTMPQVNIFIMSFPLKIFVGLSVLAFSLNYMSPMLEKIYTSIFDFWSLILK